eukprot:5646619-Pleurochrysis_carterae.AAC.1
MGRDGICLNVRRARVKKVNKWVSGSKLQTIGRDRDIARKLQYNQLAKGFRPQISMQGPSRISE